MVEEHFRYKYDYSRKGIKWIPIDGEQDTNVFENEIEHSSQSSCIIYQWTNNHLSLFSEDNFKENDTLLSANISSIFSSNDFWGSFIGPVDSVYLPSNTFITFEPTLVVLVLCT